MINYGTTNLGDRIKGLNGREEGKLGTVVAKLKEEHNTSNNTRLIVLFDESINSGNYGDIGLSDYDVLPLYNKKGKEERYNKIQYYYKGQEDKLELISKGRNGRKIKQIPVVKHVIVRNSCGNFEGFTDNYKEAENRLSNVKEAHTIYKMIPVAEVSPSIKIKKIRVKRK